MKSYAPQVLLDHAGHPLIVYARGRIKYHAVQANGSICIVVLDTLRGLTPVMRRNGPYSPKRCASYWLNHSDQPITPCAKAVLRSPVKRA